MSTSIDPDTDPKADPKADPKKVISKKPVPPAPSIIKLKEAERQARMAENEKIAKSGRPVGRPPHGSIYIANPVIERVTTFDYKVQCPHCTHMVKPVIQKTVHPKRVESGKVPESTEPQIVTKYGRCPDCTGSLRLNCGLDGKPFGIFKIATR